MTHIFLLIGISTLLACSKVDKVSYEHIPSSAFYQSFNYRDIALSPYKKGDVLLVLDLKQATFSESIIWLGVYTQKPNQTLHIIHVTLHDEHQNINRSLNNSITLNQPVQDTSLFKASVRLLNVSNDRLKAAEQGTLTVTVQYLLDGKPEKVEFIITQRTESMYVFST